MDACRSRPRSLVKILKAEFIRSCVSQEQFPNGTIPEIAFVGRSNVGKSSLINSLLQRKGLAKVSRTPGKRPGASASSGPCFPRRNRSKKASR